MTAESANRLAARLLQAGVHADPRELIALAADRDRTRTRARKRIRYHNSEQVRRATRDQVRRWRLAHPEVLKAQRARYKRRRRERDLALRGPTPRLTDAQRIERTRESKAKWNRSNPDVVKAAVARYRAKQKTAPKVG